MLTAKRRTSNCFRIPINNAVDLIRTGESGSLFKQSNIYACIIGFSRLSPSSFRLRCGCFLLRLRLFVRVRRHSGLVPLAHFLLESCCCVPFYRFSVWIVYFILYAWSKATVSDVAHTSLGMCTFDTSEDPHFHMVISLYSLNPSIAIIYLLPPRNPRGNFDRSSIWRGFNIEALC